MYRVNDGHGLRGEQPEGVVQLGASCLADDALRSPGGRCVDAGNPERVCGEEPRSADGSCRLDLGHLSGTAEAQALDP